jgi:hypothetical protein
VGAGTQEDRCFNRLTAGSACPIPTPRESVIKVQQRIARRTSPGTLEHEYADHAVGLALSVGRAAKNAAYLWRNIRRNTNHILKKQKQAEEKSPTVFFSALEAGREANARGDDAHASVDPLLPPAKAPEPVDEVAAAELTDKVRKAVKGIPLGEDCLDAMLLNEPPGETADRLGVPVHRIWRARSDIRQRAKFLLN